MYKQLPTLARLKTLEDAWAPEYADASQNKKWKSLLGSLGLALLPPTQRYCEGSPVNMLTFAETGNDNVHFGFVLNGEDITENLPIALCVPEEHYSQILAEDLHEFLCIGCLHGWNSLEDLAYNRDNTLENYQSQNVAAEWSWKQKEAMLQFIRNEFSLSWQPIDDKRLNVLQLTFGHLLSETHVDPKPIVDPAKTKTTTKPIFSFTDGKSELSDLLNKK